jgi:uncharacterized repeat protein (TIGR01451 family)
LALTANIETYADGITGVQTTSNGGGSYTVSISGFGFGDDGDVYLGNDHGQVTYGFSWNPYDDVEIDMSIPDGVCSTTFIELYPDGSEDPDGFSPAPLSTSVGLCPDVSNPPTVAMQLAQLGSTVISTDGNYSEDTTISVTAVDASSGATLTTFGVLQEDGSYIGTATIAEDTSISGYLEIYNQNPGILPVYLPSSVNLVNGVGQFVAHSLAGPATEPSTTSGGTPPADAQIKTTNFPLYPGPDLAIKQWIASGTQIDPHANMAAVKALQVIDWLQTRSRDIFANATGDVKAMLNTVSSYTLQPVNNAGGQINPQHGGPSQTPIILNPNANAMRVDSDVMPICRCMISRYFTAILLHEARHAYQASIATTGNDVDQDFLVYAFGIGVAPTSIFLDTATARTVCNENAGDGGLLSSVAYLGDSSADSLASANLALEFDAWVFASGHIPGSAPPAALTVASTHTGNFTQGQQGATYSLAVSNAAGFGPTNGTVTVTDTVSSGLTLASMTGTGWTCSVSSAACTRSDALPGGSTYPVITVTVNVAANASSPQANSVAFSGGSSVSVPTTASDPTTVIPQ